MIYVHPKLLMKNNGYFRYPDMGRVLEKGNRIARMLGISRQHLHHILAERKPVTAKTAVRLAKLFGNAPLVWMRMQGAHDAWHAAHWVDVSDIPTPGMDRNKLISQLLLALLLSSNNHKI